MSRICLLVPDGVGIKNYLYTGVFDRPEASYELYHNFGPETVNMIGGHVSLSDSWVLPAYKEGLWEKFLRESIHRARLSHNSKKVSNPTIMRFWRGRRNNLKNRLFYGAVKAFAGLMGSYKSILRLEDWYQSSLTNNPFYGKARERLSQHRPDVIFCTHQRALKVPAIFKAARELGIRTVTVIYSWDNIPKARLAPRADQYFVWSEHMQQELLQFYPEIDPGQVVVTGTPQFEPYSNPKNVIDRSAFFQRHGLDPNKKIVCFSGDDVRTSPQDPAYLNDLAAAVVQAKMDSELQIVFRRCPVDLSGRYDAVIAQYPGLIHAIDPLWRTTKEGWDSVYPTYQDVEMLVSLAAHADLVINVGSTMAFDFGMFDKPAAYINYDQANSDDWSVETVYNYQHFRSMPNPSCVYWLNQPAEIANVVQTALNKGTSPIEDWYKIITGPGTASKNIFDTLNS